MLLQAFVITACSDQKKPYYEGEQSALNSSAVISNGSSIDVNSSDNEISLKVRNSSANTISASKNKPESNNSLNSSSSNIFNMSESDGTLSVKAGNSSDSIAITAKDGDFSIKDVSQ